jgi:sigma-B regulation protein RsbU (phosphoserine phosphatase)
MIPPTPGLSAADVLAAFHRDEPALFLGAAFTTVGVLAAAFSLIRRKLDPLLLSFAAFSILYGQRMWIDSRLLDMTIPSGTIFPRLRQCFTFLVPIPAVFFFFNVPGIMRRGRVIGYIVLALSAILAVLTLITGPTNTYERINNVTIIASVLAAGISLAFEARQNDSNPDLRVIRRGLFIFIAFALFENLRGILHISGFNLEPVGFAALLMALGYVAARRTLARDYQLAEIQKELDVARRIQRSILPRSFPDSTHFRVSARYLPMKSVAGDFYDYVVSDSRQAGLLIADVSGHGVPAALIASMVKLAAASQRPHAADPSRFLTGMNAALFGNTQEQFVTAAYVHLDSVRGEFRYSAAGHPPMLLLREGKVTSIEENGLILAAFDFATYPTATAALHPGDRLFLYTDGLLEASNPAGEFFGPHALQAALTATAALAPHQAADHILATVRDWSAAQDDDLTILICDYLPHA